MANPERLRASRAHADAELGANPVGSSTAGCNAALPSPERPKIVAVEFLDGNDSTELSGEGLHFVNLPRHAKWVDNTTVANIDRLTQKTRVKVRFNQPGSHAFKVKYIFGANAAYTAAEKGRNSKFTRQEQEKSYTTNGDGTKIIDADFFVTAAGRDAYKLVAEDTYGTPLVHSAGTVKTRRLIYLQELRMQGLTSIASDLDALTSEYNRHGITLVQLTSATTRHIPNIGNDADMATLRNQSRTAYVRSTAPGKEPFVIAIAYTDQLAVKNTNQPVPKDNVAVGPGKPAVSIPIVGSGLRRGDGVNPRYLWKNIVPGEGWFVSAQYLANGAAPAAAVSIPVEKCTAVPESSAKPDMCRVVRIDVTGLPAGRGRITLRVNWVDRMRAGLAASGNLVIACTRGWWEDETTASQNEVLVHEIGHHVQMVADGTGTAPDRVATQYTYKGHVGSHCHHPLPVQDSYARSTGQCVMFGSTNGHSAFCTNCAPAVRKADVSSGWPRF